MAFALRKPPNLSPKVEAFPYQMETIQAVKDMPYAAIFHEQGLGKTKMAIDVALYWLEKDIIDTVFVITKKTLVKNWNEEIETHSHLMPRILSDDRRANSYALNAPVLLYILNYEVCLSNLELIERFQKTCRIGAILDESQKIKNPEAKLTQCFLKLSEGFTRRIIMTGTPVANRPYDIWSQIKFLDQGESLGDDFLSFKAEVDIPKGNKSREYDNYRMALEKTDNREYGEALEGINEKIKRFSLRETKKTSGIELPEKTILSYRVSMSPKQKEIYENYRHDLYHEIKSEYGDSTFDHAEGILKRLLRLVQCASNPLLIDEFYSEQPSKLIKAQEILRQNAEDKKAIVWTSFIQNAEWLTRQFPERQPAIVHGEMGIDLRNNEIDRFKFQDACKLLIATPGAAKEGLTLTVANHSIFYDRSFSLDDYLQAQDRIHRISQEEDCFIHNIIAENTIDEWVDKLLYAKYIAAQIAQGDIPKHEGEELFELDLSEILSEILNPDESRRTHDD